MKVSEQAINCPDKIPSVEISQVGLIEAALLNSFECWKFSELFQKWNMEQFHSEFELECAWFPEQSLNIHNFRSRSGILIQDYQLFLTQCLCSDCFSEGHPGSLSMRKHGIERG